MRVIAGSAKGLKIFSPKRDDVRPMMESVRAALFSSLGIAVPEANILDLFSGTGSLGIEALSRGAKSVTFVEKNPIVSDVIRRNLLNTHLSGKILTKDIFNFFDAYQDKQDTFDIILATPPYYKNPEEINYAECILNEPTIFEILSSTGFLVIECNNKQPLPSLAYWKISFDRSYGQSRLLILIKK